MLSHESLCRCEPKVRVAGSPATVRVSFMPVAPLATAWAFPVIPMVGFALPSAYVSGKTINAQVDDANAGVVDESSQPTAIDAAKAKRAIERGLDFIGALLLQLQLDQYCLFDQDFNTRTRSQQTVTLLEDNFL